MTEFIKFNAVDTKFSHYLVEVRFSLVKAMFIFFDQDRKLVSFA